MIRLYKCAFFFSSIFLISCSGNNNNETKNSERLAEPVGAEVCHRLSEAESLQFAPNDLFMAIYCDDIELFNKALNDENFRFEQINEAEGDSALAVAIKLGREDMIDALLLKAEKKHLWIKNHNDRSYVSLAAEYDMHRALDKIIEIYKERRSLTRDLVSYDFAIIDFEDEFGKNAAHYALSAAMMEKLKVNWRRSLTDFNHPWHRFYFQYDENGNLFLHSAARDQRVYVLNWYADNYCTEQNRREDEEGIFGAMNYVGRHARYTIQDSGLIKNLTKIINIPNNDGDTPIHVAARLGNAESLRFLMSCEQADPSIKNNLGRSPITELLANLDPFQEEIHQSFKDSFDLLTEEADPVWWALMRGNNFRSIMTEPDLSESHMTAIHYAYRLRDRYFINRIPEFAKQAVINGLNMTPEELRRDTLND